MTERSLYLVWNPGGENPKHQHANVELARTEARRLAELNPGIEFYVLRAVEGVEYRNDPWRYRTFCKS